MLLLTLGCEEVGRLPVNERNFQDFLLMLQRTVLALQRLSDIRNKQVTTGIYEKQGRGKLNLHIPPPPMYMGVFVLSAL